MNSKIIILALGFIGLMAACTESQPPTLFELLPPESTGVSFTNQLAYDADFNVYTYRNYYNGGGVSIGDINNDGLSDIYFTSNLGDNKLFLNKGNFEFEDITDKAQVQGNKAWSTGVSMADVNGDGWLDIYVCNSGDIAGDQKTNELFINNKDLTFSESAKSFGLADGGFSTHASFFDYDKDGDLDVYVLNNSFQAIGSFDLRRNERPKRDSLGGDKLYRNDNNQFIDVSEQAGIYGSIIGFGLGVTVGDVNNDNWDDIYVSNDFFERDYLYINQQDGTFKESLTDQIRSISGASMGADMADINNDGYNDMFVTEMLPFQYERLKTVTTFESWDRYQYSVQNGYYHQFTRNTLNLNNTDDSFSEVGRLFGVEASDWSWGALIFDMDNDGFKDLYIANGIYQDLTNQDYLQYISNEEVAKSIIGNNKVDYKKLIDIIPSNPVPNRAFKNINGESFEDVAASWGLDTKGFSNGSAYGDLDNDGDLDLVVNNVNGLSWLYKNMTVEHGKGNYIKLQLKGQGKNPQAVGARIKVNDGTSSFYTHQQPTRGFQSSVDFQPILGLPSDTPVDIEIVWPSGRHSQLLQVAVNQTIIMEEPMNNSEEGIETEIVNKPALFSKSEGQSIPYVHEENKFVDFDRDRLLYHMSSTESPKLSKADLNGDGQPDFYIGGSKGFAGTLLLSSGKGYQLGNAELFLEDKSSEDMESLFFDADGDGDLDLYVCSGGVEFSSSSQALFDRLYINEAGSFTKSPQKLPASNAYISSSSVSAADFDHDGDLDLFVGERQEPLRYGIPTSGYVLINDGKGQFSEQAAISELLSEIGMITDGTWADLNQDSWDDLVVVGEYMQVLVFTNQKGTLLAPKVVAPAGWWNTVSIKDLDGDNKPEIILGNHGKNSRFEASETSPLVLYVHDFDKNGTLDPILTKEENGKHYPFALRHNLIDQIKEIKKVYPDYESFKKVTMELTFSEEQLAAVANYQVAELSTAVLWNEGGLNFTFQELPIIAQYAPTYAILPYDFDADGDQDLLLAGNLFGAKPEVGRYDASYGTYLENTGNRTWKTYSDNRGLKLEGEVRDLQVVDQQVIIVGNNQPLQYFSF